MMIQNYINQHAPKNATINNGISTLNLNNVNVNQSSKLREILEEQNIDSLIKKKILKKKEKIKTNILNFSNPYTSQKFGSGGVSGSGYYKLHLETSAQNNNPSYLNNLKKDLGMGMGMGLGNKYEKNDEKTNLKEKQLYNIYLNNHKRSNSTYEDEEDLMSYRVGQELKKSLISPRMENAISKYIEAEKRESKINTIHHGHAASIDKTSVKNKNTYISNSLPNKTLPANSAKSQSEINTKFDASGGNLNSNFTTKYITGSVTGSINIGSSMNNTIRKLNSNPLSTNFSISQTKGSTNFNSTQKSLNFNNIKSGDSILNQMNINHNNNNNINISNLSQLQGDTSKRSHHDTIIQVKHGVSKTTTGTKNNSRKNSIDKTQTIVKNNKNLFLAVNPQKTFKASTNNSTNNSSSTLLSNQQNQQQTKYPNPMNNINYDFERENRDRDRDRDNLLQQSLKKNSINVNKQSYHNKMLSEIPVLSSVNMNLLNQNHNLNNNIINQKNPLVSSSVLTTNFTKNFLQSNNAKYQNIKYNKNAINSSISVKKREEDIFEKTLKKKMGPITMPVTSKQTKNNSKNTSKSMSRIEEPNEPQYVNYVQSKHQSSNNGIYINTNMSSINAKHSKSNSLTKKYIPITTSHSPTHLLTKDLLGNFQRKEDVLHTSSKPSNPSTPIEKNKEKIVVKSLELGSIINKHDSKYASLTKTPHEEKKAKLEGMLNMSNDSIKSTVRESNYYRRESEKIAEYIKQCKHIRARFYQKFFIFQF
jgi:hypothetical protein